MNREEKLLRIAELLNTNIFTDDEYIDKWLGRGCENLLSLIIKTKNFKKNNLRNIGDKRWDAVKEAYYNSDIYNELMNLLGDDE